MGEEKSGEGLREPKGTSWNILLSPQQELALAEIRHLVRSKFPLVGEEEYRRLMPTASILRWMLTYGMMRWLMENGGNPQILADLGSDASEETKPSSDEERARVQEQVRQERAAQREAAKAALLAEERRPGHAASQGAAARSTSVAAATDPVGVSDSTAVRMKQGKRKKTMAVGTGMGRR